MTTALTQIRSRVNGMEPDIFLGYLCTTSVNISGATRISFRRGHISGSGPLQTQSGPLKSQSGPYKARAGPFKARAGPTKARAGPFRYFGGVS